MRRPGWLLWFAGCAGVLLIGGNLKAQEATASPRRGATTNGPARERPGSVGDGTPQESQSAGGGRSDAGNAAAEGSSPNAGDQNEAKSTTADDGQTIRRPQQSARTPDPREFDVRPDANGRLRFSFHGQVWPDVLQWLAAAGGYSLDWQELPNDHIHLSTNRDMSVAEVRDLLNRLLFQRGFTLLLQGNVLLVSKLDQLDPSLLPRIDDESELLDRLPNDFVKITFKLPDAWKAEQAAEEVKPLLSSHAKVQPLMSTNRLLVVDIVANLREVSRLINSEHAAAVSEVVPREFPIKFARADYVADQVMILLGLDPSSRRSPEELQVEQQRLQLFAQMQQRGSDVSKYLRATDAPTVFLAVDRRTNSLVVNAPAKEMSVIERAVELLDVPRSLATTGAGDGLSVKRYPLATIKPESVVNALQSIGDLDPRSNLQIDSDSNTIFANATVRDHDKLQALIDKLDGTGRQFEVIWLRRLPADAVAATIHKLMVGEKEDESDPRRRYYSYFGGRGDDDDKKTNQGEFRVDADVQNNRLLLWANDAELSEVRRLLMKLGEIPGESGNPHKVRMFHTGDDAAAREVLEQLQRTWPSVRDNPLKIDRDSQSEAPQHPDARREPFEEDSAATSPPSTETQVRAATFSGPIAYAPQSERASQNAAGDGRSPDGGTPTRLTVTPAPLTVELGTDGRLLLRSDDTSALDYAEELLERIAPPKKDYEVFYLKYASASLVTLNLEEFFEEETGGPDDENSMWNRIFFGYDPSDSKPKTQAGLNNRNPIRFIYDIDTNSVLVSHATSEQLATVRNLIEIYDRPVPENSISARRFQLYKIQHARASDIAATIKDVYRDLLSSKDKIFERPGQPGAEKEENSQSNNIYRVFGSMESEDKKPTTVKASFAGALSVGVDEVTNTLIISAQEEWIASISEMVRFLDVEAEPYRNTVQVVNTDVSVSSLQAALTRVMGDKAPRVTIKQNGDAGDQAVANGATPGADANGNRANERNGEP